MARVAASVLSLGFGASAFTSPSASREAFDAWKAQFRGEGYASWAEDDARFRCFQATVEEIHRLRVEDPDAEYGLNDRSDKCAGEGRPARSEVADRTFLDGLRQDVGHLPAAAAAKDWREEGAVLSYVKDQGSCGSCWAFGSGANMEAVWFLATGQLLDLSEQELVSCAHSVDGSGYPQGCSGGNGATHSYAWVIANGGRDSADDYGPYTSGHGGSGTCDSSKHGHISAGPFDSFTVLPKNETQMAQWISQRGPLSIHIDASGWSSYRGGVMTRPHSASLDHVVLIVGYGTDQGKDYWLIRNSWGSKWGEGGYVRLARGKGASGVQEEAATIVAKPTQQVV